MHKDGGREVGMHKDGGRERERAKIGSALPISIPAGHPSVQQYKFRPAGRRPAAAVAQDTARAGPIRVGPARPGRAEVRAGAGGREYSVCVCACVRACVCSSEVDHDGRDVVDAALGKGLRHNLLYHVI
jgi:hypothetical protein